MQEPLKLLNNIKENFPKLCRMIFLIKIKLLTFKQYLYVFYYHTESLTTIVYDAIQ